MGVQEAVFVGAWSSFDIFTHFPTQFVQGCRLLTRFQTNLLRISSFLSQITVEIDWIRSQNVFTEVSSFVSKTEHHGDLTYTCVERRGTRYLTLSLPRSES